MAVQTVKMGKEFVQDALTNNAIVLSSYGELLSYLNERLKHGRYITNNPRLNLSKAIYDINLLFKLASFQCLKKEVLSKMEEGKEDKNLLLGQIVLLDAKEFVSTFELQLDFEIFKRFMRLLKKIDNNEKARESIRRAAEIKEEQKRYAELQKELAKIDKQFAQEMKGHLKSFASFVVTLFASSYMLDKVTPKPEPEQDEELTERFSMAIKPKIEL